MLPEGTLLKKGEYRVVGYMASGGFGNTYEVEHGGRLHKHMAMKEFFMRGVNTRRGTCVTVSVEDNRKDYERMQRKFFAEAERLAQLDHPHIVEVIDFFEENDTAYYVMKLIDGKPLNKVIAERGRMDAACVRNILVQVLSALKYVHAQKLYHLDLKPGNIMQNAEGHCWLIDFGASKQMSDDGGYTLSTTALPYTPRYAPLEQVGQNMEDIGPWTDIYALGATLYHLLTAQMPPKADKVNEDGAAAFRFPAGMDASMRQLIVWMMQPRRAQRPQSVEEIERWLAGSHTSVADEEATVMQEDTDATLSSSDATVSQPTKLKTKLWTILVPGLVGLGVGALLLFNAIGKPSEKKNTEAILDETPEIVDEIDADLASDGSLCPDDKHPHAIDLGLPSGTKWACCNIGSFGPHGYGDYFRWGETVPMREGDNEETYPYSGVDIGQDISGTRYDAAKAKWGSGWRMPTEEQMQELMDNCTFTWATRYGVNGALIEGRNGRSVFFPASGFRFYVSGDLDGVGHNGGYWSATSYSGVDGCEFGFFLSDDCSLGHCMRATGLPVRAVAE